MTEQQWLECADPWKMKQFLDGKKSSGIWSDRKDYLFHLAVAHWPESILLAAEQKKLADLLRSVAGNPFRPYPQPSVFSHAIEQLAAALQNGEDYHFALHDAFLEAGYPELAVQFEERRKGGWLVELLVGKE